MNKKECFASTRQVREQVLANHYGTEVKRTDEDHSDRNRRSNFTGATERLRTADYDSLIGVNAGTHVRKEPLNGDSLGMNFRGLRKKADVIYTVS